jgi:hypothetical protein
MNDRIQQVLARMAALEEELRDVLHEQETRALYEIKGKRVEFGQAVRQAHRQLKTGLFQWLFANRPQNLITGPVIYGMIVPLLVLDLSVTLYQAFCFPIYRIARVRRGDYIVLDRHRLEYLNVFEKLHCNYCGYASGLIAYAHEILARTEQYFCPIKHARRVLGTHSRYRRFLDYGEAEDYAVRVEAYRNALSKEK